MQAHKLRQIEQDILAKCRIDDSDLEALRRVLGDDWQVSRREADFLVGLRQRVKHRTPAFETFFYQAIRNHVVKDGRISAAEAEWLRQFVFADDKVDEEERQLLRQLRDDVKEVSPEFEGLFQEAVAQPLGSSSG